MSSEEQASADITEPETAGIDMSGLLPDLFERFFDFFRPAHTEGVASPRVKELARLKIAALNGCHT